MKNKLFTFSAAFLLSAMCIGTTSPALADSYPLTFPPGFTLFAYQLDNGSGTLDSIFPNAPFDDEVIYFNVTLQACHVYISDGIQWLDYDTGNPASLVLTCGEAAWYNNSGLNSENFTITGAPCSLTGYPQFTGNNWYLRGAKSPALATYDDIAGPINLPVEANNRALYRYANNDYQIYYRKNGAWVNGAPSVNVGEGVIIGPGPGCGCSSPCDVSTWATLEGYAFMANANDCNLTSRGLPNQVIQCTPGPRYALTDVNGYWSISVPAGNPYTISQFPTTPACLTLSCPASGSYSVTPGVGLTVSGLNFGSRVVSGTGGDLYVQLYATYAIANGHVYQYPCCGQDIHYHIFYGNRCSAVNNAVIAFTLPSHVTYQSSSATPPLAPPDTTTTPGQVIWNGISLQPGDSGSIDLVVTIDSCATLGNSQPDLNSSVTITPLVGDADPSDNSATHWTAVLCSYDPNDKEVSPKGCGAEGFIAGDQTLTYQVHFQNTGAGPAYQVVVRDTLDADLDASTLEQLGSSHVFVFQMNGRQMQWTFPEIYLPPESTDEQGSHGWLKYRVRPLAGPPAGTVITNQAAIYFDQNDPVLTPVTTNTITTDPLPVASFTVTNRPGSAGRTNDFTYTGGSSGATFSWDFGPDALPPTSTAMNPSGVVLPNGARNVSLRVSLGNCTSAPATSMLTAGLPRLAIVRSGSQVCLSWAGQGYEVQESGDLQTWLTLQPLITVIGGVNYTCLPIGNVFKAYRLKN